MAIKRYDLLYVQRGSSGPKYQVTYENLVNKSSKINGSDYLICERNLTEYKFKVSDFWNHRERLTANDLFMIERNGTLYNAPLNTISPNNWIKIYANSSKSNIGFKYKASQSVGPGPHMAYGSQGQVWSMKKTSSYGEATYFVLDLWEDVIINFPSTLEWIQFDPGTAQAPEFEIDPNFTLHWGPEGLYKMFYRSRFNGKGIENWDVSSFTNMAEMFRKTNYFNANLSGWNTSNCTNMAFMFDEAKGFKGKVNGWNTSNVTKMQWMFRHSQFNDSLKSFNTAKVTNMGSMFDNNDFFNQPLNHFKTTNVTNMSHMFSGVNEPKFNQDISSWDVSNVTMMNGLIKTNRHFDQDLSGWCVSKIPKEPDDWAYYPPYKGHTAFQPKWGTCP